MSENENADDLANITKELKKLRLSCGDSANNLHEKRVEAEKLRRGIEEGESELAQIQERIRILNSERNRLASISPPPVLDRNGVVIKIGTTVEITNRHTNFSSGSRRFRQSRKALERGEYVVGYHSDTFGTVLHIQITGQQDNPINKVHFVTDSGFDTWRISSNLAVYNGERGSIDEIGSGQESFYEARST